MDKHLNSDQWFEIGKQYLDLGWSIIPLRKNKRPLIEEWKPFQTRIVSIEELQKWCVISSLAGFGVVTGKLSGVYVLDIDNGSNYDLESLPVTPHVKTGSGGDHFYFAFPVEKGLRNTGGFQPNTDTRGEGGYAVLPPAMHETGKSYKWLKDPFSTALAPVPDSLVGRLRKPLKKLTTSNNGENIFQGVKESKRNDSATRVIGKLLHQFRQEDWDTEVWEMVKSWNLRNVPPLAENELLTTFNSIKRKALEDAEGRKNTSNISQSGSLVDLVLSSEINIFLNQFNEPYITLPGSGFIAEPIKSKKTEHLLFKLFWDKYGKAPGQKAVTEAVSTLRGIALFNDSEIREVHNRIGRYQNVLYYDLGDNENVAVITQNGWSIETRCPIVFQRYAHQLPQCVPQKGGNLKDLLAFVNISDEASQLLFLTHLVACFIPDIPRSAFALSGAPGSAKSTLTKIMRMLIDPSATPLITHSPNSKELIQAASHQYAIFFDNLSVLPEWLSDSLCRIVTGDAFSKRELYTNDEDILYAFKRAVGICGVNLVATKSDLLSRCLIIKLDLIGEDHRKEESTILNGVEARRPYLLGAIFDCLSCCLKAASTLKLTSLPRMADHFRYSAAAAQFLGYTIEDLQNASKINTKSQNEEAIDASTVAQVILEFMTDKNEWNGTSTEFYGEALEIATRLKVEKSFPINASVLVKKMKEVETNLLALGIKAVKGKRSSTGNTVELAKVGTQLSLSDNEISYIEETSGSVEAVEAENAANSF